MESEDVDMCILLVLDVEEPAGMARGFECWDVSLYRESCDFPRNGARLGFPGKEKGIVD